MNNISDHISYEEATFTEYNAPNIPNDIQLKEMKNIAETIFEPLREYCGEPIYINSFFRSKKVNELAGGSKTSQHLKGQAIDIDMRNKGKHITNADLFFWIYSNANYDQLIWEMGNDNEPAWVHVSYSEGKNRKQTFRSFFENNKIIYKKFIFKKY